MGGIPATGALAFLATALVIAAVFACGYGIALWIARAGNEPRPELWLDDWLPEELRTSWREISHEQRGVGGQEKASPSDTLSHTGDVHTRHVGGV